MSEVVYIGTTPHIRTHARIKNMFCDCCVIVARNIFESAGMTVEHMEPGKVVLLSTDPARQMETSATLLARAGMGIIKSREEQIVDNIRQAVFDLIHRMNNVNSIVQKSEYLADKLGMSYQQMSKIFSRHHHVTLEKFIILHKIERIKELIDQDEFSLSEIAFMMDYSSVAYLSGQFKKYTGYSVSDYKSGKGGKIPLNRLP